MTLLQPIGLLGLISLPLIVILHLLRERRKRYAVSSLKLWSFLEPEVRGQMPRRIPLSWLLFLDLLVAVLLSLALAQPLIYLTRSVHQAHQLIILMDTSTSMLARDLAPDRFTQARLKAANLLGSVTQQDIATVITFGSFPHWIGDTRQERISDLLLQVSALQAGETGSDLQSALALAKGAIDPKLPVDIEILTDEAFSTRQAASFALPLHWTLLGGKANNQAVVDITASNTNGQLLVFAKLANYQDWGVRRGVSFYVDGVLVDNTTVDIPANSTIPQVWTETNPQATGVSIKLEGTDDLSQDDSAYTGLTTGQKMNVLLVKTQDDVSHVSGTPDKVEQAFNALPFITLKTLALKDYIPQKDIDLTVFEDEIPANLPPGNILLVDPPGQASTGDASPAATAQVDAANILQVMPAGAALAEGIDFSGVRWGKPLPPPSMASQLAPWLEVNQEPLLMQGQVGHSQVYLLLADLTQGNFTQHPSFPILLGKLVDLLQRLPIPGEIHAGDRLSLSIIGGSQPIQVGLPNGDKINVTADEGLQGNQTLITGFYLVETENLAGQPVQYDVGINAGEIAESNIVPQTPPDQSAASTVIPETVQDQQPVELAPWLLGAALFGLFLEAILAWR